MRFLDWLFLGKTHELGVISEGGLLKGYKRTVMMAERRGKLKFVIKLSSWGSYTYLNFSPEEALNLKDALLRFEDKWHQYKAKEREDT